MTKRLTLIAILALCFLASAQAQSFGKMVKTADELFQKGDYTKAAEAYEKAWQKKNKKEVIFKAGEAYYLTRNYRKAAEAYQNVKDDNGQFPLVGLKYARSLKQDGQYDKAAKAFQDFRDAYTGEGKAILDDIVQTEISGCELGKALPYRPRPELELERPGGGVNTDDQEFAPVSLAPDVLYYSSTIGGQARIYRTEFVNNEWTKGINPENFPVIQNGQYCHGSLSPDGSRFYFTICEGTGKFGNLTTRCELYFIRRQGSGWSAPERLPDFINTKGVTATQPAVVHRGDVEIVYFSSNRANGRGGMDLWYTTRSLSSGSSFAQPVNLGPSINSPGDEMTPFYDVADGKLYFASNGFPSIGGFDIFSARGDLTSWSTAENIGLPYNSSADDYYFTKTTDGSGGFLASNRIFAGEKLSTKDDDILEFRLAPKAIPLSGSVFDQDSGEPLRSYSVTLLELQPDGMEKELFTKLVTDGNYKFDILPGRRFKVLVNAEGYSNASYTFATDPQSSAAYGEPVFLKKLGVTTPPVTPPVTQPNEPATTPPVIGVPGETYTARGTSSFDQEEYTSNAPRLNGVYYKIQLTAAAKYDPMDKRFTALTDLGSIQTEYMTARKLTRVLLGNFNTPDEAKRALSAVKRRQFFQGAFIVKYENGARYGKVTL